MRDLLESRFFALGMLIVFCAVALQIGRDSIQSDGPLPIQRIPAALEITGQDASGEWSGTYYISDPETVQNFVDTLNQTERAKAREPFNRMEADWDVSIVGYSGYGWHLELTPDTMRVSGVGTTSKACETDCGPLYELLNEIVQLRKAGKIY